MRYLVLPFAFVAFAFTVIDGPEKYYRAFKEWYAANYKDLEMINVQSGFVFELRYLPNEILITQELLTQEAITKKQLKMLYSHHDNYAEYSFKVSATGVKNLLIATSEDEQEVMQKQYYLIESIEQDFRLIRDGDTLQPLRCNYESNYGTAPFIQLHLAFEKPQNKPGKEKLIYRDQLFGAEIVEFDLTPLTQLTIPKIK